MLGLGSGFETLVQIWSTTPDLTADMAIRQLRAEHHRLAHQEPRDDVGFLAIRKRRGGFQGIGQPLAKRVATGGGSNTCNTCGKDHPGICWASLTCDYCKHKGHQQHGVTTIQRVLFTRGAILRLCLWAE
jgi:hypothetical protein